MDDKSDDVLSEFHLLQQSTAEVNSKINAATARIAEKLRALDEISDTSDFVKEGQLDIINDTFDTLQTSEHEELLNELIRWTKGTKVNFEEFDYDYLNQVESWQQFYTKNLEEKVDGLEQQIGTFDGYLDQMKDKIDYFHNKMGEFFSMLPTDGPYGIMYHQYTPDQTIGPRSTEQEKIKFYEAQIRCFSDALKKLQELLQGASAEIKKLKQCEADTRKQLDDLKNNFEKLRQANESKDDLIKKLKDDNEKELALLKLNMPKLEFYQSPAIEFSIGGDEALKNENNNDNNNNNGQSSRSQSQNSSKRKKGKNGDDDDDEYEDENGSHHRKIRSRNLADNLNMVCVTQNVFAIGEEEIAQYNEKVNQNNTNNDDQSNSKSVEDDEKYKEMLEKLKQLDEENKSLKDTIEASSSDDELKKLIDRLNKEKEDLANSLKEIEDKNKELQNKFDESEKAKENLTNKLNDIEKENEKLNNKLQKSDKEKENLKNKLNDIKKENEKLNNQIQENEKEKEELKNMLNQADNQIQKVNQEIQTLKEELEKTQEELNEKSEELEKKQENKQENEQENEQENKQDNEQENEQENKQDNEKDNEKENKQENSESESENKKQDNKSDRSNVSFSVKDSETSTNIVCFEKIETESEEGESQAKTEKVQPQIDVNSLFHYDCSMVLHSQITQTDLSSSEIFAKTTYEGAEQPSYQYQSTQIDYNENPLGIDNVVFYEVKRSHSNKSSRNDYLSNDDNFIAIRSPHSSSVISQSSLNNNNANNMRDVTDINNIADGNQIDDYEEDEYEIHPPFHVKVQYTPTNKNFKKLWLPKPPAAATPSNSPRFKKSGDRKANSARAGLLNSSIDGLDEGRKSMLAPMLGNPPFAEMSAEFRPRYPLLVVQSLNKPPLGGYRIDSDDVSAFKKRNSGHTIIVPRRLSSLRKKVNNNEEEKKNNSDNEEK